MVKSEGELGPIEERYLRALFNSTNGAIHAGVPIHRILAKVRNKDRKIANKVMKKLKSQGYCGIKPRGKNITWYITKKGRDWVLGKISTRNY